MVIMTMTMLTLLLLMMLLLMVLMMIRHHHQDNDHHAAALYERQDQHHHDDASATAATHFRLRGFLASCTGRNGLSWRRGRAFGLPANERAAAFRRVRA
jgi:hypothetical protein